jgi:hypothetical protein
MILDEFKTLEELAAVLKPLLMTGSPHIFGDGTGSSQLGIDGAAGNARDLILYSGGSARWLLRGNNVAEGGSDAGTNLEIVSRTDAGALKDIVLTFIRSSGDIYSTAWTDYSSDSTVTGWSSFTIKEIDYKKIGNLVFVKFRLIGTSDTTSANFTLPFTGEGDYNGACWGRDNTGTRDATLFYLDGSVPDVDIWWGGSATGFTSSGTKECAGEFFYEAA